MKEISNTIICIITCDDFISKNIYDLFSFSNEEINFKKITKKENVSSFYYIFYDTESDADQILKLFYIIMNEFCIYKNFRYNLYFNDLFYVLNSIIKNNKDMIKFSNNYYYELFDYNRKHKITTIDNIKYLYHKPNMFNKFKKIIREIIRKIIKIFKNRYKKY